MSYELNVLVNGSRCKQYSHKGRTYIEAKEGSEYALEIKNNSWEKVLAVVSVDGLNILDGEAANENGAGYVIDRYCAQKFFGFQYSNEKVATFKFGAFGAKDDKGNPLGYAASKGDGSEKNAGIIGVRIWDEVPKPEPVRPPNPAPVFTIQNTINTTWIPGYGMTGSSYAVSSSWSGGSYLHSSPTQWGTTTNCAGTTTNYSSLFGGCAAGSSVKSSTGLDPNLLKEAIDDAKAVRMTALANTKGVSDRNSLRDRFNRIRSTSYNAYAKGVSGVNMFEDDLSQVNVGSDNESETELNTIIASLEADSEDKASFDMETQWGQSRIHKVKEVDFVRKEIIHSFDIYYASRESLVAMGIDLGTEKRVSFPESFEVKYAKPPAGWKG